MLKKTLKKIIATALAVATVATSGTAVSAATLTPKKSHSKAEITEHVDYFNEITDKYTFRPDGYTPISVDGRYHDGMAYQGWQMTTLLQNTPGITSEQKADMKKAASKWKKSYLSQRMIYVYWDKWTDKMYYYLDDDRTSKSWASKYKTKAKQIYTEVNAFIAKYAKYNQKLAGELKKFNKQRLDIYNKAIDNWCFKMTKSQKAKYLSPIVGSGIGEDKPQASIIRYVDIMFDKSKMSSEPFYIVGINSVDAFGDGDDYAWGTLKLNPFNASPNAPARIWSKHAQWQKW